MKRWGAAVAVLYVLVLIVLSGPLVSILFYKPSHNSLLSNYQWLTFPEAWKYIVLALVAQAALLTIPVAASAGRPVTRRSIIPLVLSTALMTTVLVWGIVYSLDELWRISPDSFEVLIVRFSVIWAFWALFFYLRQKNQTPQNAVDRLCRLLFQGSILELLIAVPSHIIVRQRNECCAGIATFVGIACGMAVMLFAFGPGVYLLFAERMRRLRRGKNSS